MSEQDAVLGAIESIRNEESRLLRETVLPRLVRRYAADGSAAGDTACFRLLTKHGPRTELLVAFDEGLQDRNTTQTGAALGTLFADYAQASSTPAADPPTAATCRWWTTSRSFPDSTPGRGTTVKDSGTCPFLW